MEKENQIIPLINEAHICTDITTKAAILTHIKEIVFNRDISLLPMVAEAMMDFQTLTNLNISKILLSFFELAATNEPKYYINMLEIIKNTISMEPPLKNTLKNACFVGFKAILHFFMITFNNTIDHELISFIHTIWNHIKETIYKIIYLVNYPPLLDDNDFFLYCIKFLEKTAFYLSFDHDYEYRDKLRSTISTEYISLNKLYNNKNNIYQKLLDIKELQKIGTDCIICLCSILNNNNNDNIFFIEKCNVKEYIIIMNSISFLALLRSDYISIVVPAIIQYYHNTFMDISINKDHINNNKNINKNLINNRTIYHLIRANLIRLLRSPICEKYADEIYNLCKIKLSAPDKALSAIQKAKEPRRHYTNAPSGDILEKNRKRTAEQLATRREVLLKKAKMKMVNKLTHLVNSSIMASTMKNHNNNDTVSMNIKKDITDFNVNEMEKNEVVDYVIKNITNFSLNSDETIFKKLSNVDINDKKLRLTELLKKLNDTGVSNKRTSNITSKKTKDPRKRKDPRLKDNDKTNEVNLPVNDISNIILSTSSIQKIVNIFNDILSIPNSSNTRQINDTSHNVGLNNSPVVEKAKSVADRTNILKSTDKIIPPVFNLVENQVNKVTPSDADNNQLIKMLSTTEAEIQIQNFSPETENRTEYYYKMTINAFKRILDNENLILPCGSKNIKLKRNVLVKMATALKHLGQLNDNNNNELPLVYKLVLNHIAQDIDTRYEIGLSILDYEYIKIINQNKNSHPSFCFDNFLTTFLVILQDKVDTNTVKDRKLFRKIILLLPTINETILKKIIFYLDNTNNNSNILAISCLRDLILERNFLIRKVSLLLLLTYSCHPDTNCRSAIVRCLANQIYNTNSSYNNYINRKIEFFSLNLISTLTSDINIKEKLLQILIPNLKEGCNNEDEMIEDNINNNNMLGFCNTINNFCDFTTCLATDQFTLHNNNNINEINQRLDIFFAICAKNITFINKLITIYAFITNEIIRKRIYFCVEKLIKYLRNSSKPIKLNENETIEILIVSEIKKGFNVKSISLIYYIIDILCQQKKPDKNFVDQVIGIYNINKVLLNESKENDDNDTSTTITSNLVENNIINIVIPILSNITIEQLKPLLPSLLLLPDMKLNQVIKKIYEFTPPTIDPVQLLLLLHYIYDKNNLSKNDILSGSMRAIQICLNFSENFGKDVICSTIKKLINDNDIIDENDKNHCDNIPKLTLRTMILAVNYFPSLKKEVLELLIDLSNRNIWNNESLWPGFIKLISLLKPDSYNIVLRLQLNEINAIFEKEPHLTDLFVKYIGTNKNFNNDEHVRKDIRESFNIPYIDINNDNNVIDNSNNIENENEDENENEIVSKNNNINNDTFTEMNEVYDEEDD